VSSTTLNFMPTANSEAAPERTHIEMGEYRATCTTIRPPELYRLYKRWYMRVDFTIRDSGEVVSKYINLGGSPQPNTNLGPRTDYYKLWSLAVGRKPERNETMDPAKIIGVEFMVMVGDKTHRSDGEAYSAVTAVRREVETLSSVLTPHSLIPQSLIPQSLIPPTAQLHSPAQVHSGEEFPMEEIPPRGQQRWELLKGLKESDPQKAQRFTLACNLKDAA